jgi:hypothetical protein
MKAKHPKRLPRWAKWTLGVLALLLSVAGIAGYTLYIATRQVPEFDFEPPRNAAEANRQDLTVAREAARIDRSFSSAARTAFDAELDRLEAGAGTLSRGALEMGLARAFALADNAHTSVRGVAYGRTLRSAPVRLAWFGNDLHIIMADPANAPLLGARVLAIGGIAPDRLSQRLRAFVGGPPSFQHLLSPGFMASPEALHAIGLMASPDRLALRVALPSGEVRSLSLGSGPQPPLERDNVVWPVRHLAPTRDPADPRQWVHVLDRANVPLYLSRPETAYWQHYVSPNLLYVQVRRMRNQDGPGSFSRFLDSTIAEANRRHPRFVVVDLRASPGGDYSQASDFTERLPQAIPGNGHVFILVGPNTFSAAIVVAARLKHFAADRATIIGEPMGDRPNFWAEGGRVILPNSKILVRYSTAYHDWANGCGLLDVFRCFFLNYRDGVAAGSLAPAIVTSPSFAEYARGFDPAMAAVDRLMQPPRPGPDFDRAR